MCSESQLLHVCILQESSKLDLFASVQQVFFASKGNKPEDVCCVFGLMLYDVQHKSKNPETELNSVIKHKVLLVGSYTMVIQTIIVNVISSWNTKNLRCTTTAAVDISTFLPITGAVMTGCFCACNFPAGVAADVQPHAS